MRSAYVICVGSVDVVRVWDPGIPGSPTHRYCELGGPGHEGPTSIADCSFLCWWLCPRGTGLNSLVNGLCTAGVLRLFILLSGVNSLGERPLYRRWTEAVHRPERFLKPK